MFWRYSNRADPRARRIADRHYSRQSVGAEQFVQPGRCVVLYAGTSTGQAYWVTSWPFPEYVKHAWPTAWQCSAFRNEGAAKASELIKQAISATRSTFGDPPPAGLVTFIDRKKVKPFIIPKGKRKGQQIYGQTFRQAGFVEVGETKGGLLVLQLTPDRMPVALRPLLELEAA